MRTTKVTHSFKIVKENEAKVLFPFYSFYYVTYTRTEGGRESTTRVGTYTWKCMAKRCIRRCKRAIRKYGYVENKTTVHIDTFDLYN